MVLSVVVLSVVTLSVVVLSVVVLSVVTLYGRGLRWCCRSVRAVRRWAPTLSA
ncbi:hypothetical protein [Streptomyces thermolilacinus]|uniref:hypothetical protein n=1 Tax=Streptomyces thermolilacinus TaxID=285540 RepID=UPI000414BD71|nr:hypothetical protein [Streptomyces thermolilacinus]